MWAWHATCRSRHTRTAVASKTMFMDLRQVASAVYRVTTESSTYILGFHEDRRRTYVIVRGLPGTDREHLVIRDSDPRIGDASMFELPTSAWIGKVMEIGTMTSSAVTSVIAETDRAAISSVGGDSPTSRSSWLHPTSPGAAAPAAAAWTPHAPGLPERPRNVPGLGRGTNPAIPEVAARGVGYQVVVGQRAPAGAPAPAAAPPNQAEVPYPWRHVLYAENAAALLRSIARRERLFEDVAGDRELRQRLSKSLDDCADLLELIRRRNRR
jgi:hypothetical protein